MRIGPFDLAELFTILLIVLIPIIIIASSIIMLIRSRKETQEKLQELEQRLSRLEES